MIKLILDKTTLLKCWVRELLICLLLVLLSSQVIAQSSVWKISKNGREIYLGGTLHLLTKADYPLPGEFDLAYQRSDIVYFETDITKLKVLSTQKPYVVPKADKSANSDKLEAVLKPQTIRLLKLYLKSKKLSFTELRHLSPNRLYHTLIMLELSSNGLVGEGVDVHFSKRALIDKKPQRPLETAKQHMGYLDKSTGTDKARVKNNQLDQLILNGLNDTKTAPRRDE